MILAGYFCKLMENQFITYLQLGFNHITDFNGYDHMLFLLALTAIYTHKQWKKVLVLVTGFTLGHSLTLALAGLSIVQVNSNFIELLIPVTILITAIFQFISLVKNTKQNLTINFLATTFFGLIHGLGFSNFFKAILGSTNELILVLFSFNLGIEIGQLLIVAFVFIFISLLSLMFKLKIKYFQMVILALVSLISGFLITQTNFW